MSILKTEQLQIEIADKLICQDLSLSIEVGQCWAVLGMNGAGKTTLLKTLAGLRPPTAGSVILNASNLDDQTRRKIAQSLGFMGQDEQDYFPSTIMECALTGRHPHLNLFEDESLDDIEQAHAILEIFELNTLRNRMSNTLSGGEARRLSLATLLIQNPKIALLDEPLNHLDIKHQLHTLTLLQKRCTQHNAVIMSLHDINLALSYTSHALLLFNNGETLQGPTTHVINQDSLHRLYGIQFRKTDVDDRIQYTPRL